MFSKVLQSNYIAIGLALFLALILWLFAAGDTIFQVMPTRKMFADIPVVYINLDENLKASELDKTVTLVLEGSPELLSEVKEEGLAAFINLKGKEPGDHNATVYVNPPQDLKMVSFIPHTVIVSITEK